MLIVRTKLATHEKRKFVFGTGIDEVVRLTTLVKSANIINMQGEQPKVNFGDFAVIAKSWLLDTEDAGYNPAADLMPNAAVDYQDLAVLADNWLGTGASVYEKYYYHYDGLGSVIALSSISGRQAESYKYDVYGRVDYASSIGNPYLFTGRQYDPETGNYYYRARYYNPKIGRFLQTDPVGYSDGVNWYSYCSNNPINLFDPMGLGGGGGSSFETKFWKVVQNTAGFLQEGIHTALDVAGTFDPTPVCDFWNAAGYTGEALAGQKGSWTNAGISVLAIAPYAGDLGKVGKYTSKAMKYSDEIIGVVKAVEKHHQLPRQFAKQFKKAGIGNLDDYVVDLEKSAHRLKPDGLHTGPENWNKQWGDFFNQNNNPSKQDVMNQLGKMRKESGLE